MGQPIHTGCTILYSNDENRTVPRNIRGEYNKIGSNYKILVTHGNSPGVIFPAIHFVSRNNTVNNVKNMAVMINLFSPQRHTISNRRVEECENESLYVLSNPSNIGYVYRLNVVNSNNNHARAISYGREVVRDTTIPSGQTYANYYVKTLYSGYGGSLIDDEKLYGVNVVDYESYNEYIRRMDTRYNSINWQLSVFQDTSCYEFSSWQTNLFVSEDVFEAYPQMSKRRMTQMIRSSPTNRIVYVPRGVFDKMFIQTHVNPVTPSIEVLTQCKNIQTSDVSMIA